MTKGDTSPMNRQQQLYEIDRELRDRREQLRSDNLPISRYRYLTQRVATLKAQRKATG